MVNSVRLLENLSSEVQQELSLFKKPDPNKNRLLHFHFHFHFLFVFVFVVLSSSSNYAQVGDTTLNSKNQKIVRPNENIPSQSQQLAKDSSVYSNKKLQPKPTAHSPKKAALMSTFIPGLGQLYNKKYWKVPIIYVGLVGLAYEINTNQTKYDKYLTAYRYRIDGDPSTIADSDYSDENLNLLQQYYKRYRNLSVIGATVLYIMNIVDASVDAHMFTFDVSDDLSFNIHPTLINTAYENHFTTGLSLNIKF